MEYFILVHSKLERYGWNLIGPVIVYMMLISHLPDLWGYVCCAEIELGGVNLMWQTGPKSRLSGLVTDSWALAEWCVSWNWFPFYIIWVQPIYASVWPLSHESRMVQIRGMRSRESYRLTRNIKGWFRLFFAVLNLNTNTQSFILRSFNAALKPYQYVLHFQLV